MLCDYAAAVLGYSFAAQPVHGFRLLQGFHPNIASTSSVFVIGARAFVGGEPLSRRCSLGSCRNASRLNSAWFWETVIARACVLQFRHEMTSHVTRTELRLILCLLFVPIAWAACAPCSSGRYCSVSTCTNCPAGTYFQGTGATSVSACVRYVCHDSCCRVDCGCRSLNNSTVLAAWECFPFQLL